MALYRMSTLPELRRQKIKNDGAYYNFAGNIVSPIWRFKEKRNLWKNAFGIGYNNYNWVWVILSMLLICL